MYHYEPDLVSFVPFFDTNPLIISRFDDVFPIIPRLICQGNARLMLEPSIVARGLSLRDREFAALKRAMDSGWDAGCWEVQALAVEMKKRHEAARAQRAGPKAQ
jgi:hypothetical protein